MLEGWSRELGTHRDDRVPISLDILKGLLALWPTLCSSPYEECLFHVVALLAFFGKLRVSELVAHSRTDRSERALLDWDVRLAGDQ